MDSHNDTSKDDLLNLSNPLELLKDCIQKEEKNISLGTPQPHEIVEGLTHLKKEKYILSQDELETFIYPTLCKSTILHMQLLKQELENESTTQLAKYHDLLDLPLNLLRDISFSQFIFIHKNEQNKIDFYFNLLHLSIAMAFEQFKKSIYDTKLMDKVLKAPGTMDYINKYNNETIQFLLEDIKTRHRSNARKQKFVNSKKNNAFKKELTNHSFLNTHRQEMPILQSSSSVNTRESISSSSSEMTQEEMIPRSASYPFDNAQEARTPRYSSHPRKVTPTHSSESSHELPRATSYPFDYSQEDSNSRNSSNSRKAISARSSESSQE